MSHLPERKEKICLNCKSVIYGRYCHVCGQENTEPKETFWGLVTHFVYDVTHFDGKFFDSTRFLLTRPGFLAAEYLRGRRASYLNPIRMYVFTSAFFFIIFFSFINKHEDVKPVSEVRQELLAEKHRLDSLYNASPDSSTRKELRRKIRNLNTQLRYAGQTGFLRFDEEEDTTSNAAIFGWTNMPATVTAYDSQQRALPAERRDNWLQHLVNRKRVAINEKYRHRSREFWNDVQEKLLHTVPQMMFVSLPLVALLLQLLYIRRKQYYYVNHLIFTIYIYIAVFILMLLFYGSLGLYTATNVGIFRYVAITCYLSMFFYVYKAMRNFYRQRRAKTIFKFILLMLGVLVLMLVLMVIYFLTSAYQL